MFWVFYGYGVGQFTISRAGKSSEIRQLYNIRYILDSRSVNQILLAVNNVWIMAVEDVLN